MTNRQQSPIRSTPARIRQGRLLVTAGAAAGAREALRGELGAAREADRVTLNQFAPPSVLVDADLRIRQFRGATDRYLKPSAGKARPDLLTMARAGLKRVLRTVVNRAKKDRQTVRVANVWFRSGGRDCVVNLEVVPLQNLAAPCYLVFFEAAGGPGGAFPIGGREESGRITGLERTLAETRDHWQSMQKHQKAANEKLQASHDESQFANEELQGLNRELETSRTELESTNEAMGLRNAELNRLNSDLTNLQTSTKLVIVLLGRDLTIRRYSAQAEKQFHLQASDLGRPIGAIRHHLDLPDLAGFIRGVITTRREGEREVRDKDGRCYSLRVRPYVTLDHRPDGAVLVLVDISERKQAEQAVASARDFAEAVIDTVRDPLLVLDADLLVRKANAAFRGAFRLSAAQLTGRSIFAIDGGRWNLPGLRTRLKRVWPHGTTFDNFEVASPAASRDHRTFLLNARTLGREPGRPEQILLDFQDITERRKSAEALRRVEVKLAGHAVKLESLVTRRTVQLTAANRRLVASVDSVARGQEEYRILLQESYLMQAKLRSLTHQILTVQEEERKRISRELHDEVVQTLVSISVELASLSWKSADGRRHLHEKIARTQRLVENSVQTVHRFARDLRPAVLDDLGLIPALQVFRDSLEEREPFKVQLVTFKEVETLSEDKRTVFFRVAQEALHNVARHAQATRVKVRISKIPGAVRMIISDNGRSFAVKKILQAKNNRRLGLVGMRERVQMVGGSLTIESAPGRGTRVCAEIPFTRQKAKP